MELEVGRQRRRHLGEWRETRPQACMQQGTRSATQRGQPREDTLLSYSTHKPEPLCSAGLASVMNSPEIRDARLARMKLENIVLSEVGQSQRSKCQMFSLI